ncbi:hypothetical protein A3K93_07520 [Acinetobacter sp. NCu2D-2]|uniref:hypothetical protein n=1 Tax=Acinetobacter sp. NCu2D-2 TaxID=1608473 RepID=UPI0007CDDA43|nr:hypothetical protein [Acinetobacter sp. NCu2D-2]ANF82056.1 hypothetical protein A3K93_07520 [Acinetobacter sp. NCu2D-2]
MHNQISLTMFYSLLFAMGGAPTIAMMIIRAQTDHPEVIYQALIGLSVIIACILVPLILIQNVFLFLKRKHADWQSKIESVGHFYLVLNILCLGYWILLQILS